jgi:hypothetical protein
MESHTAVAMVGLSNSPNAVLAARAYPGGRGSGGWL